MASITSLSTMRFKARRNDRSTVNRKTKSSPAAARRMAANVIGFSLSYRSSNKKRCIYPSPRDGVLGVALFITANWTCGATYQRGDPPDDRPTKEKIG